MEKLPGGNCAILATKGNPVDKFSWATQFVKICAIALPVNLRNRGFGGFIQIIRIFALLNLDNDTDTPGRRL